MGEGVEVKEQHEGRGEGSWLRGDEIDTAMTDDKTEQEDKQQQMYT